MAYYALSCAIAVVAATITSIKSTTRALAIVNIGCIFLAVSVEIVGSVISGARGSSAMSVITNRAKLVSLSADWGRCDHV